MDYNGFNSLTSLICYTYWVFWGTSFLPMSSGSFSDCLYLSWGISFTTVTSILGSVTSCPSIISILRPYSWTWTLIITGRKDTRSLSAIPNSSSPRKVQQKNPQLWLWDSHQSLWGITENKTLKNMKFFLITKGKKMCISETTDPLEKFC